jgi:hypothetical protein
VVLYEIREFAIPPLPPICNVGQARPSPIRQEHNFNKKIYLQKIEEIENIETQISVTPITLHTHAMKQ